MDIILDLKNEKRSKVNIEMSWKISVAERKGNIWDRLPWVRNNQEIKRHVFIDIQNISVPDKIEFDKDALFSIVSNQQEFETKSFPIENQSNAARHTISVVFQSASYKRLL